MLTLLKRRNDTPKRSSEEVKNPNMEVKRALRRRMATIMRKLIVKNAVFSLFEAFPGTHFCCFISANLALGLEMLLKAL